MNTSINNMTMGIWASMLIWSDQVIRQQTGEQGDAEAAQELRSPSTA